MKRSIGDFLTALFVIALLCPITTNVRAADSFGIFPEAPQTELLKGRKIKLLSNFEYRDEQNRTWVAPKGYISDGASIPRVFWSFLGGPLDDSYRYAAILHDYFCDQQNLDWAQVHLMFYNAMRAANVRAGKAWVMYQAVNRFGPRWTKTRELPKACMPGPDFSANDCVINSSPYQMTTINREVFNRFATELRSKGYGADVDELAALVLPELD